MRYIYDTDSAKRCGAKRAERSEAKLCGLYEVHSYIDYIKNNIL